jgi:sugar lactone lactonase YvrE
VDFWRFENDFLEGVPVRKPYQFVSPDGSTFLPAGDDFIRGTLYYGSKMHDVLRAFALAKAEPGKPFYVSDEGDLTTYSATVDESGTLTNMKWFANQGGEGAAVDSHGNLYMAAGQIFVYSPTGLQIREIDVPERPTALVFGGKDHKTLFIAARSSLYAIRIE